MIRDERSASNLCGQPCLRHSGQHLLQEGLRNIDVVAQKGWRLVPQPGYRARNLFSRAASEQEVRPFAARDFMAGGPH